MFPPEPTDDICALVESLQGSLQRAGANLVDVLPEVREVGGRCYWVRMPVATALSRPSARPAGLYIKQYAKASGWDVHRVTFERGYVSFFISSPASRASKKR